MRRDSFYTSQPHAPHHWRDDSYVTHMEGYESHHTLTGEESRTHTQDDWNAMKPIMVMQPCDKHEWVLSHICTVTDTHTYSHTHRHAYTHTHTHTPDDTNNYRRHTCNDWDATGLIMGMQPCHITHANEPRHIYALRHKRTDAHNTTHIITYRRRLECDGTHRSDTTNVTHVHESFQAHICIMTRTHTRTHTHTTHTHTHKHTISHGRRLEGDRAHLVTQTRRTRKWVTSHICHTTHMHAPTHSPTHTHTQTHIITHRRRLEFDGAHHGDAAIAHVAADAGAYQHAAATNATAAAGGLFVIIYL